MSQVIMQLFFLGFVIFVIYLIYCIIHTHKITVENQEILMKLLSIEKKKQKEQEIANQPGMPIDPIQNLKPSDPKSDVTQEISVFEEPENQSFWS